MRGRTGQAGPWPHRTSRPLACRKGGCVAGRDEPPSCVPQGRVRGRTGQAAFLRAARAGAWPDGTSRPLACRKGGCVAAQDKPPSCVPQGRVRGRTGQAAFSPAARAGAWPHRTSRPFACRKGGGESCLFLGLVAAPFSSADSVKRWCPPGISAPASSLHKACVKTLCLSSL